MAQRTTGREAERGVARTAEQTICWIDGKILPASEARIPVLDHGFLFGDGVFEGIRVTRRGIFRFADHMKRLETAARAIGLAVPAGFERVHDAARETTRAWGPREGYLRLVVTRGRRRARHRSVDLSRAGDRLHRDRLRHRSRRRRPRGASISSLRACAARPADVLDPRVKSLNYLNNVLAKREATVCAAPTMRWS